MKITKLVVVSKKEKIVYNNCYIKINEGESENGNIAII